MAPVVVHMPGGPVTPELPVFLDANEPLVLATVFLPWKSHAAVGSIPARASLPTWLMTRVWTKRCSLSTLPADLAILAGVDVFEFGLSAAAWGRILTELVDSELLDASFTDASTLDAALEALTVLNPGSLVILASDLLRGETFDTPGTLAVPGRPGRQAGGGRAAVRPVAAVPAVPPTDGPAVLRFIHLCRLPRLEEPADKSPLLALALAAGAFGVISTRASRDDEAATVTIAAAILRPNIERYAAGGGILADAAVAVNLPKVLVAAHRALGILRTSTYTEAANLSDLTDGLRYLLGGFEERQAIEARRSLCAKDHVRRHHRPNDAHAPQRAAHALRTPKTGPACGALPWPANARGPRGRPAIEARGRTWARPESQAPAATTALATGLARARPRASAESQRSRESRRLTSAPRAA